VPPLVCHPHDHVFGVDCHPDCRFGPRGHLCGPGFGQHRHPVARGAIRRRF